MTQSRHLIKYEHYYYDSLVLFQFSTNHGRQILPSFIHYIKSFEVDFFTRPYPVTIEYGH